MTRQGALLRGINLGNRNRVSMARLQESLSELGYGAVRTHLQSRNVVFTAEAAPEQAERDVAERLARDLGGSVPVLVRTRDELAEVVAHAPLREVADEPARYLVTFLEEAPDPRRTDELDPAELAPDRFHLTGRELYLWCPSGVRRTRLTKAFLEKHFGLTATSRNWNTVTRLLAMTDESPRH